MKDFFIRILKKAFSILIKLMLLFILLFCGIFIIKYFNFKNQIRICSNSPTLKYLDVEFKGFTESEMLRTRVRRYKNNQIVDSFVITPKCDEISTQKGCTYFIATLKDVYVADVYEFIVADTQCHKLYNMEKVFIGSMDILVSTNKFCTLDSYTIDGINYKKIHDFQLASPCFEKVH